MMNAVVDSDKQRPSPFQQYVRFVTCYLGRWPTAALQTIRLQRVCFFSCVSRFLGSFLQLGIRAQLHQTIDTTLMKLEPATLGLSKQNLPISLLINMSYLQARTPKQERK